MAFIPFRTVIPVRLKCVTSNGLGKFALNRVTDAMKMHGSLWVGEQQSVCTLQLTLSKIDMSEKGEIFPVNFEIRLSNRNI